MNNSEYVSVTANVYFSIIPEWVLYGDISAVAVRTYATLRRYADNTTGECFPSRKTLAMKVRCSIKTLDNAIHELEEFGAIQATRRRRESGNWTSNLYVVYTSAPAKGVAQKTTLPSAKNDPMGSVKNDPLTRAINYRNLTAENGLIEKQLLSDIPYKPEPFPKDPRMLRLMAKALFRANLGEPNLMEVAHKAATDPQTGELNEVVFDEFNRLVAERTAQTESKINA